jgi:AraC-like DNA-binding protein
MNTPGSKRMFDPVFAAAGDGLRVSRQAAATARVRVVWLVTLEGSAAWTTDRGRRWLRPGSILVFTPRGTLPSAAPAPGGGWRAVALGFAGPAAYQNGRYIERRFGSMQSLPPDARPVTLASAIAAAGARELATLEGERAGADWVAELHQHLGHHHAPLSALFTMGPEDPGLASFAGRTVKDLALEMGFSRTYLTRKLAAVWGRAPSEVLRTLRVRKAESLLRNTPLPVTAVAAEAGFDSVSGLFAAFKRVHRATPGAYRSRRGRTPPAPRSAKPLRANATRPPDHTLPRSRLGDAVHAPDWDGPYFRLLTCGETTKVSTRSFDIALSAVVKRCAIVITLAGKATFATHEREIPVRRGVAVAYPVPMNACWQGPVDGGTWRRVWLQFHGPLAEAFFEDTLARHGHVHDLAPESEPVVLARELVRRVRARSLRPAMAWSQLTYRWLLAWRHHLDRHAGAQARPVELHAAPSRLLSQPPRTLQAYADQLGYSVSFVSQKLKNQWNDTPGRVLRGARLDIAAEQLRTTLHPVHLIARECGYRNPSTFIVAFKRREGLTPLAYRHRHRSTLLA